jgi:hypothetical protein
VAMREFARRTDVVYLRESARSAGRNQRWGSNEPGSEPVQANRHAVERRPVPPLTRWCALERDEHGTYRVGSRLWEVAALAPRGTALREAALPFLEDLYEATHQNIRLAVLDDMAWAKSRNACCCTGFHPAANHPNALRASVNWRDCSP